MNSILGPVISRSMRVARDVANFMAAYLDLIFAVGRLDTAKLDKKAEHLHDTFVEFLTEYAYLKREIEIVQTKAAEMEAQDAGRLVDATQDNVFVLQNVDSVLAMDYVNWARHTLALMPDLFEVAIREVASYDGGPEQLLHLKAVIEGMDSEIDQEVSHD